jgi:solute carrier family 30 (zinc transporter), member 5/7
MKIPQSVLALVASACVVAVYSATCTTGTSLLWLSAFSALSAFFVRATATFKLKLGAESLNGGRRVDSTTACAILFASFLYGLKTLGPLRFVLTTSCVAGLTSISRCRKGPRFAKSICTAVCCTLLVVVSDPAQPTTPSLIYGAIGFLCTALAGRLAVSETVKSADTRTFLYSAAILAIIGLIVTVMQKHDAAANEMVNLLFFFVSVTVLFACVSLGLVAQASTSSLAASVSSLMASSLLCSTPVFQSPPSWEFFAVIIALLSLFGAHKGLNFADSLSASIGSNSFNPAQLFKRRKQHSADGSIIATLMANSRERKLFVFLVLTVAIMLLEFAYGVAVNSLGLISDSFHMMLDGTSIAIGLYAAHAASWRPDEKTHPFGYARYEVFGGFVNGILLLFIALYVTVESIQRIIDPPEIDGPYLLLVSCIGLVVNIIGILFFHDSHGHSHTHSHGDCGGGHADHNMRGVYLHILADLLGSVSVIISSVIIYFFGFWIADPICSALSAVLILLSAFPLLEETGKVLLLSAPEYKSNYSDELRTAILETSILQDVGTPTVWVHSTPPRELTICTVAGKMRSNTEYSSTRKRLIELVTQHMMKTLDVHNVSVIVHLE